MLSDPKPVAICCKFHYFPGNWVWLHFSCAVQIWGDLPTRPLSLPWFFFKSLIYRYEGLPGFRQRNMLLQGMEVSLEKKSTLEWLRLMGFGVQNVFFNWASPEFAKVQPIWGRWGCLKQTGSFLEGFCSNMFNQCSTHLGLLGLPNMANFGPKNAIKWPKKDFLWDLFCPLF